MNGGIATVADPVAVFWDWIHNYVVRPHPEIGRPGAVCPFVPALVKNDGIFLENHDSIDGTDADAIEVLVRAAIPTFLALPQKVHAKSLVLLFPEIPDERGEIIDVVHARLKDEIVHAGLMAGQFYPLSTEPAARNPHFFADQSPYPLLVLRHMAIHDVLFLDGRPEWFATYHARFQAEYARGRVRDPLLRARFAAASARMEALASPAAAYDAAL